MVFKRLAASAAMATAMLIGAIAEPAIALDSPQIQSPDDGAAGRWWSGTDRFQLADIKCDGRYVYIQWDWDSSVDNGSRFSNHNGCDFVGYYYPVNTSGHSVIYWKVCTEYSGGPDSCSSVRSDVT